MIKRPPQHRVDAEIVYVLPFDDAWDKACIEAEIAAASEADRPDHPVTEYHSGATRFDLGAMSSWGGTPCSARDYVDLSTAVQFRLRRLAPRQFARIQAQVEVGTRPLEAWIDSCKYGLDEVVCPDMATIKSQQGELSEVLIAKLCDDYGHDVVYLVGQAAYLASIPLTPREKKVSG